MRNSTKTIRTALYLAICLLPIPYGTSCRTAKSASEDEGAAAAGATAVEVAASPFQKTELAEGAWRITEPGTVSVNMYLVAGAERALLIDTGMGTADLGRYVKTLTSLPVSVVNTHGHSDHAGGNRYFDAFFAHPDDLDMARRYSFGKTDFTPVREGYVFDLGGRKLTVIETPGHTRGSICLWDAERKLLFTGDNNNSHSWLFLYESTPLETYRRTLEKLIAREADFAVLYPGHGGEYAPAYLRDLAECARLIIAGEVRGVPYQSRAGAESYTYKDALIAFNPNKLTEGTGLAP